MWQCRGFKTTAVELGPMIGLYFWPNISTRLSQRLAFREDLPLYINRLTTMTGNMTSYTKFLIGCALALMAIPANGSSEPEFERVVNNPRAYHHKEVTLIAMADVGGDRFILYQPPKARSVSGLGHEIYVDMQIEGPNYDRFNGKWVIVTGIVDADHHGLAYYACELIVKRARLARKARG